MSTTTETRTNGGTDTVQDQSRPDTQSAPESVEDTTGDLSKDRIFGLLKVQRRREVVRYLDTESAETTLSDVAEHIAAKENDCTVTEISANERKRVYVALYQCHLPKMDDADVIEFDRDRGTIERREAMAQLLTYLYLDADDGTESSWTSRVRELVLSACRSLSR